MAKVQFKGFKRPSVEEKPKPKPRTFSERLVDRFMVESAQEKKAADVAKNALARQCVELFRSFFGLPESEIDKLQLFTLGARFFVEYEGLSVMPIGSRTVALVFACPYCGSDCVSNSFAQTESELGGLILDASNGQLEPEVGHLKICSAHPVIPVQLEAQAALSPAEKFLHALREVIGESKR